MQLSRLVVCGLKPEAVGGRLHLQGPTAERPPRNAVIINQLATDAPI